MKLGSVKILMDEFLVSGETHIRNLESGWRRATEREGDPVGYLPDMFGHIAQMPQVLRRAGDRPGGRVAWGPIGDRRPPVRVGRARTARPSAPSTSCAGMATPRTCSSAAGPPRRSPRSASSTGPRMATGRCRDVWQRPHGARRVFDHVVAAFNAGATDIEVRWRPSPTTSPASPTRRRRSPAASSRTASSTRGRAARGRAREPAAERLRRRGSDIKVACGRAETPAGALRGAALRPARRAQRAVLLAAELARACVGRARRVLRA